MKKWTEKRVHEILHEIVDGKASGPKDRKRQRIVEAATSLFVEQGYRKTSLDEVARLAGVAKGTIYLYAKSKAELLLQALAVEKLKYSHLIAQVMDPAVPARERLRRYIEVALVTSTRSPLYAMVLSGDMDVIVALNEANPIPGAQKGAELNTEYLEELLDEVAEGKLTPAELKDRAKALTIVSLFGPRLGDDRMRQGLSVERAGELISNMIANDIVAPEEKKP